MFPEIRKILDTPILYQYAKAKGQISSTSIQLLNTSKKMELLTLSVAVLVQMNLLIFFPMKLILWKELLKANRITLVLFSLQIFIKLTALKMFNNNQTTLKRREVVHAINLLTSLIVSKKMEWQRIFYFTKKYTANLFPFIPSKLFCKKINSKKYFDLKEKTVRFQRLTEIWLPITMSHKRRWEYVTSYVSVRLNDKINDFLYFFFKGN